MSTYNLCFCVKIITKGPWAIIRSPAYLQMPCNRFPVLPQQMGHQSVNIIKGQRSS